ncbi:hypothetical protein A4A49_14609 [Nicotiana attenuata]|uniref:F-box protein n=1 Tax=Nicotiana attenuata TaxID=49451 RepID=A0A314KY43_NICAT|nr:hypothetical protein A4A49_14609 [Nicotiana attenuata]
MNISNGFFQHLFSRSQSLESLILDCVYKGLERFKICGSQSVRILKITDCNGIAGEIDASNLVSLEYSAYQIPMLKIENESSQLKHSHISLDSYPGDNLNSSWFCELNKFLLNSISWSQVSLQFYECNEINMKDLQLHQRVATPQVDVLNVNFLWPLIDLCPTFVDALLWSCHPKRFNLRLSTLEEPTIEMICFMDHLLNMKN